MIEKNIGNTAFGRPTTSLCWAGFFCLGGSVVMRVLQWPAIPDKAHWRSAAVAAVRAVLRKKQAQVIDGRTRGFGRMAALFQVIAAGSVTAIQQP